MEGGEKMPAIVRMSGRELEDLIEKTKTQGNDASLLEQLLAKVKAETPAQKKPKATSAIELGKAPQELVTSTEELERLRTLACPHIKSSPFWEEFVSRRVLVCNTCQDLRPGDFGEQQQPALFDY